MKSSFMIKTGQFLFRYRSLLFPLIFISILLLYRPHYYVSRPVYGLILSMGFLITMLGEAFRVFTIGFDYIDRGGLKGAPHASRLVHRGVYAHVRNPMYVGNLLIALGISLYSGAPWVLVTILPFFVFVYYAIIAAEEHFLRGKFGLEFEDYCKQVNRLWPSFRGAQASFSGFKFNWRRALEKDNGTAFYTFLALTLVPLWRMYFGGDNNGLQDYLPFAVIISAFLVPAYLIIRFLRNTGRLASS